VSVVPWGALLLAAMTTLPGAREGHVLSVTATRAYLACGLEQGLGLGQDGELLRAGRPLARCRVDAVSESFASCVPGRAQLAREGDRFVCPGSAERAGRDGENGPDLPRSSAQRWEEAVARASVRKVEHPAKAGPARRLLPGLRAGVDLGHETTAALRAHDTTGHREQLDVRIWQAAAETGLALSLDLTAVHWLRRSAGVRFEPDTATRLWLREAAVGFASESGWLLASGRVRPRNVRGMETFDGALAGWRLGEALEIGAFAGRLPDMGSLVGDQGFSGGAWYSSMQSWSAVWLRHEAWVAWARTPRAGTRLTLMGAVDGAVGSVLDAGAEVRAGVGPEGGSLDAVRLDLSGRPLDPVRLFGVVRYDAVRDPERMAAEPLTFGGEALHAAAGGSWEVFESLTLRLDSGVAWDRSAQRWRSWLGPELVLPRLLGRTGSVAVGWNEEVGHPSSGRAAYLQSLSRPWTWLRLLGRVSYLADTEGPRSERELGLFARGEVSPFRQLHFRLWGHCRFALEPDTAEPWPVALVAGMSFGGEL